MYLAKADAEAANAVQELDARGRDGEREGRAAGKENKKRTEDKRPFSIPYPFP